MHCNSRRHIFAVVIALLCGVPISAHEIGTTRVSVLFQEGRTYGIEIVTDATALAEKFSALSGSPPPADTGAAFLQSWLTRHEEMFRKRLKVAFDETEVRPTLAY